MQNCVSDPTCVPLASADQVTDHVEVTGSGGCYQGGDVVAVNGVDRRPVPQQRSDHVQVTFGGSERQWGGSIL